MPRPLAVLAYHLQLDVCLAFFIFLFSNITYTPIPFRDDAWPIFFSHFSPFEGPAKEGGAIEGAIHAYESCVWGGGQRLGKDKTKLEGPT